MAERIDHLLDWATQSLQANSDTGRLDAEVLLAHLLDKSRSFLRAWPEHTLSSQQHQQFRALVSQRQQGIPIAYLVGEREFWSRPFSVSPDVLIPRPDTEILIEHALALIADHPDPHIIDLGTGSGVIAITLAKALPHSQVIGVDISPAALAMAQRNAQRHDVTNLTLLQSDWFTSIPEGRFDLIVSNPPYIAENDPHLQQGDVRFEPTTALISAEQGLYAIRTLAGQARQYLQTGAYLLIEHGYQQQHPLHSILQAYQYQHIATHCDLGGNPRVTLGQWNPS